MEFINEDKNSYRVISLGMSPSIALYNGFYTLDSYENSYPLSYKKDFRELMENEIVKNVKIKNYYDNWGCRCYFFPVETYRSYYFNKNSNKKIKNLNFNTKKFIEMGGKYIFSAVEIVNAEENNIKLEKTFETTNSYWKVYLYKVNI